MKNPSNAKFSKTSWNRLRDIIKKSFLKHRMSYIRQGNFNQISRFMIVIIILLKMEVSNHRLLSLQIALLINKLKNLRTLWEAEISTEIVNLRLTILRMTKNNTKICQMQETLIRCFQWIAEKISIQIVLVSDQTRQLRKTVIVN